MGRRGSGREGKASFGKNAFSSMSSPPVVHRTLAVPRAGAGEAGYEDAVAIWAGGWPVCAAVADGATESVFARAWAEHLAQGLVERAATTDEAFRDALPDWQVEWRAEARGRAEQQPWYVAAKAAEGAFAALLGLSLHADGTWRAVSVGDCCLFHVRTGVLEQSWPVEAADAFTNRPALVPSRSDRPVPPPDTAAGTWQPQDTFLLATDAVAAWLLDTSWAEDASSSSRLADAVTWNDETFHRVVETARTAGALRNDDATLLVLHAEPETSADDDAATM